MDIMPNDAQQIAPTSNGYYPFHSPRLIVMEGVALKSYLHFADRLSEEAGQVMAEGFYGEKEVDCKSGNTWDLVTNYDKQVEDLIMSRIKQRYPTHQILAEEDTANKAGTAQLTAEPTWIIDPIDGTYNYVHGLSFTCISMALSIDRQVVVALVYNPLTRDKYTAIKGEGAYHNGKRIHVSPQCGLDGSIVSFEISLIRIPHLRERNLNRFVAVTNRVNGVRSFGSAALTLCLVASGALDAYFIEWIQAWDMAAGVLIVEEAGGIVSSMTGEPFDLMKRNIVVSSNSKTIEDIMDIFKLYP